MKLSEIKTWGLEIDNVILKQHKSIHFDSSSSENLAKQLFLVPDALVGLRLILQKIGPESVWLISKANQLQFEAFKIALERFKFFSHTGLKKDRILSVPEHIDKRPVVKSLNLSAYIDRSPEVIHLVQSVVRHPFWFAPDEKDSDNWIRKMSFSVRVVSGWKQIMEMF